MTERNMVWADIDPAGSFRESLNLVYVVMWDSHDYDAMEQGILGVYRTEFAAQTAVADGYRKGLNFAIDEFYWANGALAGEPTNRSIDAYAVCAQRNLAKGVARKEKRDARKTAKEKKNV